MNIVNKMPVLTRSAYTNLSNAISTNQLIYESICRLDTTCAICLDTVENTSVYHTPCGHTYHSECFRQNITRSTNAACCPMCRNNIVECLRAHPNLYEMFNCGREVRYLTTILENHNYIGSSGSENMTESDNSSNSEDFENSDFDDNINNFNNIENIFFGGSVWYSELGETERQILLDLLEDADTDIEIDTEPDIELDSEYESDTNNSFNRGPPLYYPTISIEI